VRRRAVELEGGRDRREGTGRVGGIPVAGVPPEHDVHVAHQAVAHHVDLAAAALLCRRAVIAKGPGLLRLDHPVLHGDRGGCRRRPEQVVTAGVPGGAGLQRTARCFAGRLRERGQRVEFADDRDDGLAAAVGRRERGWHPGDARLDREAGVGQRLLKERAALRFLEPELGLVPDLLRDCGVVTGSRVERREDRRAGIGSLACRDGKTEHGHEPGDTCQLLHLLRSLDASRG